MQRVLGWGASSLLVQALLPGKKCSMQQPFEKIDSLQFSGTISINLCVEHFGDVLWDPYIHHHYRGGLPAPPGPPGPELPELYKAAGQLVGPTGPRPLAP